MYKHSTDSVNEIKVLTGASLDPSPELALPLLLALTGIWFTCAVLLAASDAGGNVPADIAEKGPTLEAREEDSADDSEVLGGSIS